MINLTMAGLGMAAGVTLLLLFNPRKFWKVAIFLYLVSACLCAAGMMTE